MAKQLTLWQIFMWPILIFVISLFGIVVALLADGLIDVLASLALGSTLFIAAWCALKQKR